MKKNTTVFAFLATSIWIGLMSVIATGKADEGQRANSPSFENSDERNRERRLRYTERRAPCKDYKPTRQALFGDLHVHTALSFDAVAGRIGAGPEDAYRYAKGESIPFFPQDQSGKPTGVTRIERPLDFAAVTDHSEFLGERALCNNPDSPMYEGKFCIKYREIEFQGTLMMASVIEMEHPSRITSLCGDDGQLCREWSKRPWQQIIDAAESVYDRSEDCTFTSLVGYEYTGTPGNSNYHRNVIFRTALVPSMPISYVEAPRDYLLWQRLDRECSAQQGCDYITIPHNSNLSNGRLLTPYADLEQTPENRKRYARTRLQREPLMEIFQHKGTSECVNGLSSVLSMVDELCDQEQVRIFGEVSTARNFHLEGETVMFSEPDNRPVKECEEGEHGGLGMFSGGCISRNDFLRSALLTGMSEQSLIGLNPVKMGIIASTDGHVATPGNVSESDWRGTVSGEMSAQSRLEPGTLPSGIKGNPGGLAGVWAVENSRDAIFEALKRRETFGTSGPRITPRFFGGWDFPTDACDRYDVLQLGYEHGVPMGGDLTLSGRSRKNGPTFIIAATRDPQLGSAPLQKLQLVKGWLDSERRGHVKVVTVAGRESSSAGVDLTSGRRFGEGYDSLCTVFTDDEFDAGQPAYYYLRVVENPSARWSLYDCLRLADEVRPEVCSNLSDHIINEMAWTSPIWYLPDHLPDGQRK